MWIDLRHVKNKKINYRAILHIIEYISPVEMLRFVVGLP